MSDSLRKAARDAVRRRIRVALLEQQQMDDPAGQIAVTEQAVFEALDDPTIAWALAYQAGVQMAPALHRAHRAEGGAS